MSRNGSVSVNLSENETSYICSSMFRCTNACRPLTVNRILSAAEKRSRYFRRLLNVKHMDFENASWEMIQLIISPQKLFRNFKYRSRRQWARDDPAFLVLLVFFVLVFSLLLAATLGLTVAHTVKFIMWSMFWDFLVIAFSATTFFWIITNRFFVDRSGRMLHTNIPPDSADSHLRPEVEWGYAFDIHLNAFFPALLIIGVLQLPFLYFSIGDTLTSRFIGNTFWLMGGLYYNYITFLGYSALPFLKRTAALLLPMNMLVLLFILAMVMHWNANMLLWHFYWFQI